ncbi:MAG: hypothetical protein ACKO0Z_25115 [Betaproteobacteria bacterium]
MGFGFGDGFDQGAELSRQWKAQGGKKPKKTVFAGDQVIHVWAQRSQEYGRNSKGTCYFEGDTLYSYGSHFIVARFLNDKRGRLVCLFNLNRYSNTTSGQQSAASYAVKDSVTRFTVKNPGASWEGAHADNFAQMVNRIRDGIAHTKNTRVSPGNRAAELARLPELLATAKAYRDAFLPASKYPLPKLPKDLESARALETYKQAERDFKASLRTPKTPRWSSVKSGTLAGVVNHCDSILKAWERVQETHRAINGALPLPSFDPAPYIKRKAEAEQRKANLDAIKSNFAGHGYWGCNAYTTRERRAIEEIDKRNNYARGTIDSALHWIEDIESDGGTYLPSSTIRELESIAPHCATHGLPVPADLDSVLARAIAASKRVKENEREAERLAKLSQADKVAAWRDGKSVSLPYDMPTLIRLKHDGITLQTSRGAEFPADHARKVWPVIKSLYAAGKSWRTNGQTLRLGHFQIDAIETDGTIKAGCHKLRRDEIEHTAQLLNLS